MPPEETSTAVVEAPASAATATGQTSADWRSYLTDELKADPVVKDWSEKASEKAIGDVLKGYAHATKRMGNAINLPGKDAKPEDVQALRTKLYEAGVFEKPPADPKDYAITKPEQLPDGIGWNDELAGKFAATLHKHGAPKALAGELSILYMEALTGAGTALKTSQEAGLAALKAEYKDEYDARAEAVTRMIPAIFQSEDDLAWADRTGLSNHPGFLSFMMRLAPFAMQDSSFLRDIPVKGGELTGDQVREEVTKIMTDTNHPDYKGYHKGEKSVMDKIDALYKKAYGNAKVEIGGGALKV